MRHSNPQSMVSRESRRAVWARRHIQRRKPVLYHFEIHITDHCNLNCKGCAHFSNLCPPTFADLAEFESDMRAMAITSRRSSRSTFSAENRSCTRRSPSSCVSRARRFPDTRIYLMTNGTLVTRMDDDFWSAMAETGVDPACDSYPIDLPVERDQPNWVASTA